MTLTTPTRPTPTIDRPEVAAAQPTATPASPRRRGVIVGGVAAGLVVLAAGALGAAIVANREDTPARDVTTPLLFEHGSITAIEHRAESASSESHGEVAEHGSPTAVDQQPPSASSESHGEVAEHGSPTALDRVTSRVESHGEVAEHGSPTAVDQQPPSADSESHGEVAEHGSPTAVDHRWS